MFTGLVQGTGTVLAIADALPAKKLVLDGTPVAARAQLGSSIAINGCCLTVVAQQGPWLTFDVGPETLARTNLGQLQTGSRVNLESSLRMGDEIGGHLVSGHIDGIGTILGTRREDNALLVELEAPEAVSRVSVTQGSVALDGVSLTIVAVEGDRLRVSLIPHTASVTTLARLARGVRVNLEADLIAKYVHAFVAGRKPGGGLTWEKLAEAGF